MSASLPANSGPLFNSLPAAGCRILAAVQVVMTTLLLASPASGQLTDSTASTASNSADIWICEYDIAADQSRRLFVVNDLLGVGDVQYGPGDLIAFDGQVAGRHATSSSHVFVCERDGSQRRDLGPGHKSSWSPRGRRLCVSRNSPEYGVWLLNADGQDTRLIDNRGWGASWSGGGQKIAYVRSLDGRANLVVWNLVEDELSALLPKDRIAAEARIAAVPRWSPDDARLACRVSEERGQALLVVTVSNQKSRVVWKGDGLQPGYSWQDESRLLVAIDDDVPGRSRLFRLDVNTGQTEPVPQQYPERSNSLPCVRRDGGRFLYVSRPRT
ncbi:MAG: hypothetical protein NXI04_02880 [Planctomycetaceae bacterium]|nr:hypothetical protein [Planctomycetaceae bacterium]